MTRRLLTLTLLILPLTWSPRASNADVVNAKAVEDLPQVGYVEKLTLSEQKVTFSAKVDTGAKTSSLHAETYELFKRNGKRWIKFKLVLDDGKTIPIEAKLHRFVRIRRAGVELRRRPVIKLPVCMAGISLREQFTLADRSDMNYEAIVGRSFLKNRFLVNSGQAFLKSGFCPS